MIDDGIIDRLVVSDGSNGGFVVPTADQRVYEHYIGQRPLHGRIRIEALGETASNPNFVGSTGPTLDSLVIEVHCTAENGE